MGYRYPEPGMFLPPAPRSPHRIRFASLDDVPACKHIADAQRAIFGFLTRAVFTEAATRRRLLVVEHEAHGVIGFLRFNHRRRGYETALYDIGVDGAAQRQGMGRALVDALVDECRRHNRSAIVLRCPESVEANGFYARLGFRCGAVEPGRKRSLLVWRLSIHPLPCSS